MTLDVGQDVVFGTSSSFDLFYTPVNVGQGQDVTSESLNLTQIDMDQINMNLVSVSPSGSVWSIDTSANLGHFTGSSNDNRPIGRFIEYIFRYQMPCLSV